MSNHPAAWLAVAADGSESSAVYMLKEQAEAAAREWGWFVVPLYALPSRRAEDEIAIEAAWERTGLNPTWPADEAGCGVKYANAMAQEIERLRQFDRLQPIEPADATPATQATPGDGSVHGGSSTPKSYEKSDEKRVVSDMNHDAAPAAKARTDPAAGEPGGGGGSDRTDKPAPRTAVGTGDICERLRCWFKDVNAVPATDLMDEAAAEIERLRIRRHERDAIAAAAESVKLDDDSNWTTLIELLERTK